MEWFYKLIKLFASMSFGTVVEIILILIVLVFIYGIYIAFHNGKFYEIIANKIASKEVRGSNIRLSINPKISQLLTKLLYETGADRACILELHNGKENPCGLPFIYCDMTYEETKEMVEGVSDECENLNLSKFNISNYMYEHNFYIGSVENVKKIDKKFAQRLINNENKYIGIILIKTDQEIGFLQILYKEKPEISTEKIYGKLGTYVQQIGRLLDFKIQSKEYDK